jgi:hypothetical protein
MRLKLEKTSGCSMKIYRCAAKPLFYGVRGPAHFQISRKSQPFVPRASYHRDAALALVWSGNKIYRYYVSPSFLPQSKITADASVSTGWINY